MHELPGLLIVLSIISAVVAGYLQKLWILVAAVILCGVAVLLYGVKL